MNLILGCPTTQPSKANWKGGKHWSEVLADDALQFIDMTKQDENPFFMYLAFNAPHDPKQSPKEYIDMYPVDKISIPKTFMENILCRSYRMQQGFKRRTIGSFSTHKIFS